MKTEFFFLSLSLSLFSMSIAQSRPKEKG